MVIFYGVDALDGPMHDLSLRGKPPWQQRERPRRRPRRRRKRSRAL
jgi:hypothetical protein